MDLIQHKVIPYVGHRHCEFYSYEYYHKPIDRCLKWDEYQHQHKITQKYGSDFKVHEFMDYPSYEILWRCYQKNCPAWREGIHSRALQQCLGHKEFCTFFNIPFDLDKSSVCDQDDYDNLQDRTDNSDTDSENEDDEMFAPKVTKKNQQLPLKNIQVSHEFKQNPRCCDCFGQNGKGTCARKCRCKKEGRACVCCYPSSNGN